MEVRALNMVLVISLYSINDDQCVYITYPHQTIMMTINVSYPYPAMIMINVSISHIHIQYS